MNNEKKSFIGLIDLDIKSGNSKRIPIDILKRIGSIRLKAEKAKKLNNTCENCGSLDATDVFIETPPDGFHEFQKLCTDCINKRKETFQLE